MNIGNLQVLSEENVLAEPITNIRTEINIKEVSLSEPAKNHNKFIYAFFKRIIDILGSVFGIILLIPMTIILYIANKMQKDNGPLFYVQERIGKDGKIFKMYKYRSMVTDAEQKLEEYLTQNKDAKKEYERNRKLKNDPRITKVGSFIRKTSIDEFPQFINVLKGDMSLVGPRPYLPRRTGNYGKSL